MFLLFIYSKVFSQSNIEYKDFVLEDYKNIREKLISNEIVKEFAIEQLKTCEYGFEISTLLSNLCWYDEVVYFSDNFFVDLQCTEGESLIFEENNSLNTLSTLKNKNLKMRFSKITKEGFLVVDITKDEEKQDVLSWPDRLLLFLVLNENKIKIIENTVLIEN